MAYVIEKNIPVPANIRAVGVRYPLASMSVGDSFAVPVDPHTTKTFERVQARVAAAAHKFCKGGYAGRFTIRILRDKREVRIWRIS